MGEDPAQASGERYRHAPCGPTREDRSGPENRRSRRVQRAQTGIDRGREATEHHVLVAHTVDHVKQPVISEPCQQGHSLGLVQVESTPDRLFSVISAAPGHHAGCDLVDGNVQVHRTIQGLAGLGQEALHGRCLVGCTGIAIQEESVLDHVGLGQSLRHDPVDQVVTHEVTGIHQGSGLATQPGTGGHRCTQHVAGGDVDRAVGLDQTGRLSSLT